MIAAGVQVAAAGTTNLGAAISAFAILAAIGLAVILIAGATMGHATVEEQPDMKDAGEGGGS